MTVPTLSITQDQQFTALRGFLRSLVPSTTEVFKAQQNRVPEPRALDFVVMTPLRIERLGTNLTQVNDSVFSASITLTTMTVDATFSGEITVGATLSDGTAGVLAADTSVVSQVSGTTGGVGVYRVSRSQALPGAILYGGVRTDQMQTEWVVQLDIHGPSSADNTQRILTLFRSEVAYDAFLDSGFQIVPLHADDSHQVAFQNAEQQYEYRWVLDVHCQVNPVVGSPQQFAQELETGLINVDVVYPP